MNDDKQKSLWMTCDLERMRVHAERAWLMIGNRERSDRLTLTDDDSEEVQDEQA